MNEERTAKQGALSALKELVFWVGTLLFTLALFFTEAFTNAVIGIVIQFIVIPIIVSALKKAKYI